MGMAASQARLLTITARIHDVEYQAQAIQTAKLQLATQSDKAYKQYLDALDATTLTLTTIDPITGQKSTLAASFNNLCSRNRLNPAVNNMYALRDVNDKLIVEDDIAKAYNLFSRTGLDDPYQFALFVMNGNNHQGIATDFEEGVFDKAVFETEENVFQNLDDSAKSDRLKDLHKDLVEMTGDKGIYCTDLVKDSDKYNKTLEAYRAELYKNHAKEIFDWDRGETNLFNNEEFRFFISIYNQIKQAGGCVSIENYNGTNGNAANDSEWLKNMVEAGQISIAIVSTDSNDNIQFNATSPSSDSVITFTETTEIDKTALAKAEAKYNQALRDIDKKDKQYDLSLSKLETERSALTKEYDSVTKVIEENIERTFGIFS